MHKNFFFQNFLKIIILFHFLHLNAFAELPDLGSSASVDLSLEGEKILGGQIYNRLLNSGVILDDAEATDFLKLKLKRIISAGVSNNLIVGDSRKLTEGFDIFLINDPMLNAFALPGAKIGVHTGLIFGVETEGEFMSVLTHELAHVTQRHISRMYGNNKDSSALMMAAAILSAMALTSSNAEAAMGIISLGQGAALQRKLNFSKSAENEADRVGLRLLQASGYDPKEMISMLEKLNLNNRLSAKNAPWFSTHPFDYERIAEIKSRTSMTLKKNFKKNSLNQSAFDWIKIRLENDLNLKNYEENNLTLVGSQERNLKNLWVFFWSSMRNGDLKLATKTINKLFERVSLLSNKGKFLPMISLAKITLFKKLGKYLEVIKEVESIEKNPAFSIQHHTSRALLRLKLEALLSLNQLESAEKTARWILENWPNDYTVWGHRAIIAEKLDQRSIAHIYTAEKYAAMGEWKMASEQLRIAMKGKKLDYITLSKLDFRLKQINSEIRKILQFTSHK